MVTAKTLKIVAEWSAWYLAKKAYRQEIKSVFWQLKTAAKRGWKSTRIEPPDDERVIKLLQKRGFTCKFLDYGDEEFNMFEIKWE